MKALLLITTLSILSIISRATAVQQEYLTIVGSNIWVRSTPTDGNVVMKLSDGDKCLVFGKKRLEIIRGTADYWYNIEFKGKRGWVFGSQTSLKKEPNYKSFSSIDEIVKNTAFNSDLIENWEGDPSVIKPISRKSAGGKAGSLCVVSFDNPGFMTGRNFTWVGFKESDLWKCWEFPGESVDLRMQDDKWLLLMFVKSTGGAYTLKNDYILYTIDAAQQTIQVRQIIFTFAEGIETEVSGGAKVVYIDNEGYTPAVEKGFRIQIEESIDHNYENGRKGTFNYTFQYNEEKQKFLPLNN